MPEERVETLTGTAESVIFAAPSGGFSVFRLRQARGAMTTVAANAPAPLLGQDLELTGVWVVHPRFGRQFQARTMLVAAPTSLSGIERFLASGAVAGVGPRMAQRIVAKFGQQTLTIIERSPKRLTEVEGIGQKTAEKIHTSYMEKEELREIMVWLETHGVSGTHAARIYERYSSFSLEILEQHPYRLTREVQGIGFMTADAIAASTGRNKEGRERIAAGLEYILLQVATQGHTCMIEEELISRTAKLLAVERELVDETLKKEVAVKRIASESVGASELYYPAYLYQAEKETAERLLAIKQEAETFFIADTGVLVEAWEEDTGFSLAKSQQDAVESIMTEGVFVLTGGPGTGKTTVIRAMIDLLTEQGLEVVLAAPTGRAAKRLSEATGRETLTVHRLLGAQGGEGMVFDKDEDTPIEADVIIVDEASMLDIVLMRYLLKAVPKGAHLILSGDVDQLPSVGAGAVLYDILRSKVIPSVRLTEIFRQGEGSGIVLGAHAINRGQVPQFVTQGDLDFVELPEAVVADHIVELCTSVLPQAGFSVIEEVQVLSPMHRLEAGVESLNQRLQEVLNPPSPEKPEYKNSTQIFRLGDKVMQLKNNYTKGVFNGDIGFIIEMDDAGVKVRFSEELTTDYAKRELIELTLAYAMSVHKSQGSEYPVVLVPLVRGHSIMLQRNLLYTAVTRAKEKVILLGERAALLTAIGNDRTRRRYTLLAERLTESLG